MEPFQRLRQRRPVGHSVRLVEIADHEHRRDRQQLHHSGDRVGLGRSDRVEEPAQHRTDDRGTREGRRPERHDVRELLVGRDQRRDRAPSGRQHRLGGPHRRRDREHRQDTRGVVHAVERECDGAHAAGEDEHRAHTATVEPVRHPAADEHEHHGRDELGETEQADREFVAGDVVRLLEQHRHHQVEADRAERGRDEVLPDRPLAKNVAGAAHPAEATDRPGNRKAHVRIAIV